MSDISSTQLEDPRLNGRPGFAASLAGCISDLAARRDAALGASFSGHRRSNVEALERLADHIPALDEIRDRRIAILADVNAAFADLRREEFRRDKGGLDGDEVGVAGMKFEKPTPLQNVVLTKLAEFGLDTAPTPDQTITDLAAAGVRDLLATVGSKTTSERQRTGGLVKEVDRLTAEREQARVDANEVQDLRAERDGLRAELAEALATIEEQRVMLAKEPKKPRRSMIEPNIYRSESGGLEVAEAMGKGRTKFHVVQSLGEARLLREELRGDDPEPSEEDLDAALDAKEAKLGHELSEAEIDAVREELGNSNAALAAATEEVTA